MPYSVGTRPWRRAASLMLVLVWLVASLLAAHAQSSSRIPLEASPMPSGVPASLPPFPIAPGTSAVPGGLPWQGVVAPFRPRAAPCPTSPRGGLASPPLSRSRSRSGWSPCGTLRTARPGVGMPCRLVSVAASGTSWRSATSWSLSVVRRRADPRPSDRNCGPHGMAGVGTGWATSGRVSTRDCDRTGNSGDR